MAEITEVSIKAHTRRSKNGKSYQVKGYTRRVGRKGVHSPKKGKPTPNAGEEFEQVKEKPYYTTMSAEEIAAWDDAARKASLSYYGRSKDKGKRKKETLPVEKPGKKKRGFLERLEKKLQRYIKKYK